MAAGSGSGSNVDKSDQTTTDQKLTPRERLKRIPITVWTKYKIPLAWTLYALGVLTFLAAPLAGKGGYGDERAMLLGQTSATFRQVVEHAGPAIINEILPHLSTRQHSNLANLVQHASTLASIPTSWHNISFRSKPSARQSKTSACSVVHSISRAERGDGTEALAVVFPIRTVDSNAARMAASIGVLMKKMLQQARWLAKDVAIVFVENDDALGCSTENTVQAWLRQYDGDSSINSQNTPPKFFPTGGNLHQAVIIDLASTNYNEARISIHGTSGRLPNYDFFWLVRKNIEYYSIQSVVLHPGSSSGASSSLKYWQEIRTAFWQWLQLALMKPTGAHTSFLERGIDATTVTFSSSNDAETAQLNDHQPIEQYKVEQMISLLESTVRSCNNLQERLHHASGLYLLLSPDRFVPVGVVLAAPLCLFFASIVQCAAAKDISSSALIYSYKTWQYVARLHALIAFVLALLLKPFGIGILMIILTSIGVYSNSIPALAAALGINSSGSSNFTNKKQATEVEQHSKGAILAAFLGIWVIEVGALLLYNWALSFALSLVVLPCTAMLLRE